MGLFNFFRKKKESDKESSSKDLVLKALDLLLQKKSPEEVLEYFIEEGISDLKAKAIIIQANNLNEKYFEEKPIKPVQSKTINEQYAERLEKDQEIKSRSQSILEPHPDININLKKVENGHGDHFAALFGFNTMQMNAGKHLVQELAALSIMGKSKIKNSFYNINEVDFVEIGGDTPELKIRTISTENDLISAYPYLRTNYWIPFETTEIATWVYGNNEQANIYGSGKDTFGLWFYATDYAVNRELYIANPNIKINISAFAFIIEEYDFVKTPELSEDFVGYLPSVEFNDNTCYNFVGEVINYRKITLTRKENTGYLIRVKLINYEEDDEFFTIDIFVNNENLHLHSLKTGLKIVGSCWFQGEIKQ